MNAVFPLTIGGDWDSLHPYSAVNGVSNKRYQQSNFLSAPELVSQLIYNLMRSHILYSMIRIAAYEVSCFLHYSATRTTQKKIIHHEPPWTQTALVGLISNKAWVQGGSDRWAFDGYMLHMAKNWHTYDALWATSRAITQRIDRLWSIGAGTAPNWHGGR